MSGEVSNLEKVHTVVHDTDAAAHGADAAAHGADAAAHGSEGGFPPFDASLFSHQIFWFAISFIALYVVLAVFVLPAITRTLSRRAKTIADDLAAAKSGAAAADAAKEAADAAMAKSRADARAAIDAVRKDADAKAAAANDAALAANAEKLAEAETRIAAMKSAAIVEIDGAIGDLASDIVARLTGKAPTAAQLKAALKTVQ